MKIQIKSLKVARFASQETLCFEAKIYLDGKLRAHAENSGHGGSTTIWPIEGGREVLDRWIAENADSLLDEDRKAWDEFYAKHSLKRNPDSNNYSRTAGDAFNLIIDRLVDALDSEKQNATWHRKGVVYRIGDGEVSARVYKKKIVGHPEEAKLRAKLRSVILTENPEAQILSPEPLAGTLQR
tara:strand:- start:12 stop:560 length:549 start_codon:yes stop_codon:yes gene_type:complete